ncbi:MAG TPA: type 2 isopentenyl-diphosphate Delta-isomerase [Erysipelothrix sp.]|nr:type 2 isopentenyl-diphosphate Delta-isomerase [Erysipelothrix sp.]
MSRKDEHVQLALKQAVSTNDFDKMRLVHHSLGAVDIDSIDYQTTLGSLNLQHPFYINAMTGGSDFTKKINRDLAMVAKETGLMMAVGSMSAVFRDPTSLDSFKIVREMNPQGLVLANLNLNYSLEQATQAISIIDADGIQFHLNSPQEITMPEGDRHFEHWPQRIQQMNTLKTTVIIKEVGFGMSAKTIQQLIDLNTKIIDVSGKGGTNFIEIESARHQHQYDYLSQWGQSTLESLLHAQPFLDQATIMASGGIRHPLDVVKSLVLGAKAVGVSKVFLTSIMNHGVNETIQMILQWQRDIKYLMALVGARNLKELKNVDYLLNL